MNYDIWIMDKVASLGRCRGCTPTPGNMHLGKGETHWVGDALRGDTTSEQNY